MSDPFQFSDLVEKCVKQSGYSYQQVADLAGLANKTTISSWINGGVKRPRGWHDLIRFARALELGESETTELLLAAGQPALSTLRDNTKEPTEQQLLNYWLPGKKQTAPLMTVQAPFQVPREDVTQFIGREKEKKEIEAALRYGENKVCVVQGMGGLGKSALAIHMAHQLRPYFPDGVLWARVTNQESVPAILYTIADAYHQDVRDYQDLESLSRVIGGVLVNKKMLLLLDNIQNSEELRFLLPPNGACAVLITTRNQRAIGEWKATIIHLEPFAETSSLALFRSVIGVERLTKEEEAARRIIHFVGGLPLALRVIASTLANSKMKLEEYRRWLMSEPDPLENLADWENTHQNVRASFEVSYKLLPPFLQTLFASFSLFDGPDFSTDAIFNNAHIPKLQVQMHMGRLCALSLVEISDMAEGSMLQLTTAYQPIAERYRLHPLLKLFAREKLGQEFTHYRPSVAAYFSSFAYKNRFQHDVLKLDLENVLAALQWAHQHQQWQTLIEGVLGLTWIQGGVVGFMDARGHWHKAREILSWALPGAATLNKPLWEASLLTAAGAFAVRQADFATARPHLEQAMAILQQLPLAADVALVRSQICDFMAQLLMQQDRQAALVWIQRGIEFLQGVETEGARFQEGYLFVSLASLFGRLGELERALETAEIGLSLLPPIPTSAQVRGLIIVANVAYARGDFHKSISQLEQGIGIAKELHDLRQEATLLLNLANNYERQGNFSQAMARGQEALRLYQHMGDVFYAGGVQSNLAKYCFRLGDDDGMFNYLQQARDVARQHQLKEIEAFAGSVWGEWFLANGRFPEAETALTRVKETCHQLQISHLLPTVIRLQAEAAFQQGQLELAHEQIETAFQLTITQQDTIEEGICWRIKAQLAADHQPVQTVIETFQKSLSRLQDRDIFEWARSQAALAAYYQKYVKEEKSREIWQLLQDSRTIFAQLKTRRELEAVHTLISQAKG